MFHGIPIIGLAGGIGSGKSFIARCFADQGCCVVDSDAQVRSAYVDQSVRKALGDWWGTDVFLPGGEVDRAFIARIVFGDAAQRRRLEQLIHPWVNAARRREMERATREKSPVAFVWDTPLLFESGLAGECDSIVFIDVPEEVRLQRVQQSRGWDLNELQRRENSQWPLYKKREISDHVLTNTADAAQARDQVRELIPRILAQVAERSVIGGH